MDKLGDIMTQKSLPQINVKIWRSRLNSQLQAVDELKNFLDHNDIARKGDLTDYIEKMRLFAKKQFDYFYYGFGYDDSFYNEPKNSYLEYSPDQPPEFVFRSILNQLAYDTSAIERAIKQRAKPNSDPDSHMEVSLKRADVIAHRALSPALGDGGNFLKEPANVITYFQKVPEVLVVPYANVALIGIPYSAMGKNKESTSMRDYLSIPHEVGHYIYWRGRTPQGERLHVELRRRIIAYGLGSYENWLEEIFADVYGCLVGGEVMGLSAQDIHFDDLPTRLIKDNQKHPAPVIRPYIYMYTLNRLRRPDSVTDLKGQNFVGLLHRRWKKKMSHRGNPQSFDLRDKAESKHVTMGRNDLRKIVNIILDIILNNSDKYVSDWGQLEDLDVKVVEKAFEFEHVENSQTKKTEEQLGPDDAKLEKVYENFIGKLASKSGNDLSVDKFDEIFVSNAQSSIPSENDSWAIKLRESQDMKNSSLPALPASIWNVVFVAGGWGPGSGDGDANTKGLEDDET